MVLLAMVAVAAEPASSFAGEWVWSGGQADEDARLAAIEATVVQMPLLFRPFARSRIASATEIAPRLTIVVTGPDIRIGTGSSMDVTSRWDGAPVVHAGDSGAREVITRQIVGDTLIHDARQADGYGHDEYRIVAGTLTVTTTIGSDQLPGPIRWAAHYRRAR